MTVQRDFDLSSRNTFGMKVKCSCFVEYDSAKELEAIDFDSLPRPFLHIGSGSNLLFTGDFPGTVLHSAINYIKYFDVGLDEVPVVAGSGTLFDEFVQNTVDNGLWGAENLSLIPGEVGAAAVQNIGAYGVEVADLISGVVCYDLVERKKVSFKPQECAYAYRDSVFKNTDGRYIVTSVLFRVSRKYSPRLEYKGVVEALGGVRPQTPAQVRQAICDIRRHKLPDPAQIGSAGSFFRNPVLGREQYSAFLGCLRQLSIEYAPHYDLADGSVKVPAAWLIEQCGFKGAVRGGAGVYEKQPLVLINASGSATPAEIIALENEIIGAVQSKFRIKLSPEVQHV